MGGLGNDQIDGGAGSYDIADFSTTAFLEVVAPVTVDLGAGTATGHGSDSLTGMEAILGSDLDDTLTGDAGPNIIFGLGGNDVLTGADGDDAIDGGPGRDGPDAGPGADKCRRNETTRNCEESADAPQHPVLADAKLIEIAGPRSF